MVSFFCPADHFNDTSENLEMQQHSVRLPQFTALAGNQILQDKFYQVTLTTRPLDEEERVAGRPVGQQPLSCTLCLAGCRRLASHFAVRAKVRLKGTCEFGSCSGNRWMNLVQLLINVTGEQLEDLHE